LNNFHFPGGIPASIRPFQFPIRTHDYDKEKYREMLLEAAETVLGYFGFDTRKKNRKWWDDLKQCNLFYTNFNLLIAPKLYLKDLLYGSPFLVTRCSKIAILQIFSVYFLLEWTKEKLVE
jgi:hypothetical protein